MIITLLFDDSGYCKKNTDTSRERFARIENKLTTICIVRLQNPVHHLLMMLMTMMIDVRPQTINTVKKYIYDKKLNEFNNMYYHFDFW